MREFPLSRLSALRYPAAHMRCSESSLPRGPLAGLRGRASLFYLAQIPPTALSAPSGFAADANRKSMKKQAVGIGPMQENRHSQSKHLAPIRVYQLN